MGCVASAPLVAESEKGCAEPSSVPALGKGESAPEPTEATETRTELAARSGRRARPSRRRKPEETEDARPDGDDVRMRKKREPQGVEAPEPQRKEPILHLTPTSTLQPPFDGSNGTSSSGAASMGSGTSEGRRSPDPAIVEKHETAAVPTQEKVEEDIVLSHPTALTAVQRSPSPSLSSDTDMRAGISIRILQAWSDIVGPSCFAANAPSRLSSSCLDSPHALADDLVTAAVHIGRAPSKMPGGVPDPRDPVTRSLMGSHPRGTLTIQQAYTRVYYCMWEDPDAPPAVPICEVQVRGHKEGFVASNSIDEFYHDALSDDDNW